MTQTIWPPANPGRFTSFYGSGSEAFFHLLADWRAAGNFDGLRILD